MSRRAAALLALFAFAGAWIVGVWCHASPLARLSSALLAALAGGVAGGGIGFALERIVLARLAEQWPVTGDVAAPADDGTVDAAPAAIAAAPPQEARR